MRETNQRSVKREWELVQIRVGGHRERKRRGWIKRRWIASRNMAGCWTQYFFFFKSKKKNKDWYELQSTTIRKYWLAMIDFLSRRDILPVIFFSCANNTRKKKALSSERKYNLQVYYMKHCQPFLMLD